MIPGVVLVARSQGGDPDPPAWLSRTLHTGYRRPLACTHQAALGGWLACGLLARPDGSFTHRHDEEGLTVLLGGYVSARADEPDGAPPEQPAALLAALYRQSGDDAFTHLRGSFGGVILDHRQDTAIVFGDRQGSRPLFAAGDLPQGLYLAPESLPLSRLAPAWAATDEVAIAEYLVRGCFYGQATPFAGVRKLDQALVLRIGRDGQQSARHWQPRFEPSGEATAAQLLDELDALLGQATRRLLAALPAPALLLSGGVDSRLMLAYLLRQGVRLPSYSYRVEPSTGEDHVIAARLAELTGIPHQPFVIGIDGFATNAVAETLACDGRVQICDAPSSRWSHIGAGHGAMFIGDECFGWKAEALDREQALDVVGWWNIDVSPRMADSLRPDTLRRVQAGIDTELRRLTDAAVSTHPNGLKDELYYTQRVANLLNGFSARRLAVCEQARPLLDEDVVAFFTRVPHGLRVDKQLARDLLAQRFPELSAVPYSRKTSVPWDEAVFLQAVRRQPDLQDFILGHLSDGLCSALATMFDRDRLSALACAYLQGDKLPPYRDDWWSRMPGGWRFARERTDKVGTLRSLLRILQLNIYLSQG